MTAITPVIPRQKVPALKVKTVDGGEWDVHAQSPENFTLLVVYRGLHCPICKGYLTDLQNKAGDFEGKGVNVAVVSSDSQERAESARDDWGIDKLTLGYGLDLDTARKWGLFISTSNGKTSAGIVEPDLFAEPGLFLIRPDGTLYFSSVQTMPFARPDFAAILKALDFVLDKGYPARGEVVDHTAQQAAE